MSKTRKDDPVKAYPSKVKEDNASVTSFIKGVNSL